MMWYKLTMQPRDVLFFRSAQPMSGAVVGAGAHWPLPAVFHHALLSAFHQQWPEQADLHEHRHAAHKDKNPQSSFRFGGLHSLGVFPLYQDKVYLPTPADIQCQDGEDSKNLCLLEVKELEGQGDLPQPLRCALFHPGSASKNKPPAWLKEKDFHAYLQGDFELFRKSVQDYNPPEFFDSESRPGIGIDPETQAVNAEDGQFHLAEYMRLQKDVSLSGFASCEQTHRGQGHTDVLAAYFEGNEQKAIVMGGQQGVVHVLQAEQAELPLASCEATQTRYVKWVLLTPAIFTGGWLPSWVEEGQVYQYHKPPKQAGETRRQWRQRIAQQLGKEPLGRLVAACIPKPLAYSGWRSYGGRDNFGPKPTHLCVPAGAVYYFEVPKDKAKRLQEFLNAKCKSDISAEKGFGFGLCGTWEAEDKRIKPNLL